MKRESAIPELKKIEQMVIETKMFKLAPHKEDNAIQSSEPSRVFTRKYILRWRYQLNLVKTSLLEDAYISFRYDERYNEGKVCMRTYDYLCLMDEKPYVTLALSKLRPINHQNEILGTFPLPHI